MAEEEKKPRLNASSFLRAFLETVENKDRKKALVKYFYDPKFVSLPYRQFGALTADEVKRAIILYKENDVSSQTISKRDMLMGGVALALFGTGAAGVYDGVHNEKRPMPSRNEEAVMGAVFVVGGAALPVYAENERQASIHFYDYIRHIIDKRPQRGM